MDDRPFGTDSANREVNVQSKAGLSYASTLMVKIPVRRRRKLGRVQVRYMYVDLYKRSFDRRTHTRSGTGRVFEEKHDVHYAPHKLGLCRCFR